MENIGALIESGKFQEAADLLPAPDEMETVDKTIEQTSVPAETVFYSIRQDGNCEFKRKSPGLIYTFRTDGEEKHKLFFFCKDINVCIQATDEDENLPVWEVSTKKKLKIIRIKENRKEFIMPFYENYSDLEFYHMEKILFYYLMKHNLDGYEAVEAMDQKMLAEDMPEFAFLEDVVEKEIVIKRCIPVRDLLKEIYEQEKTQNDLQPKRKKVKLEKKEEKTRRPQTVPEMLPDWIDLKLKQRLKF